MCNKSHALEGLHVCARLHVQLYVSHNKAWSLKILPGIRSSEASSKAIWEVKIILFERCDNVNSFHATGLFWYPLKTENQRFSDVFRGHRKRAVPWNGLMSSVDRMKMIILNNKADSLLRRDIFWSGKTLDIAWPYLVVSNFVAL